MRFFKKNIEKIISRISYLKYRYKLNQIVRKKTLNLSLNYIIENWDDTARLSLDSFFRTVFSKNVHINIFCQTCDYGNISAFIKKIKRSESLFELHKLNGYPIFKEILNQARNTKNVDIHGFIYSDVLFNKDWLRQLFLLTDTILKKPIPYKIGQFSVFNPHDYKLFDTLFENEEFVIKNMGAFRCFFVFDFVFKKCIQSPSQNHTEIEFSEFLYTYKMFCAYSSKSYVEGISSTSLIKAEQHYPTPNNLTYAKNPIKEGWQFNEQLAKPFTYLKLRTLIIQVNYGGLGDHLFCSHLPRIAKETGRYDRVFISNHSAFRQDAFKELIWNLNPYLDGFCDEPGYNIEFLKFDTQTMNILDEIMLLHHLDDGLRYHEPELYYKPQIIPELLGKTVYDPNYISDIAKVDSIRVQNYFDNKNIHIDYQMHVRDNSMPIKGFNECLSSKSLTEFCDIIYSCKEIYCLTTGTATLAPALGKSAHVFYSEDYNETFLHSKLNNYIKLTP